MTAERPSQQDPELEKAIDDYAEKNGVSYHMARAAVNGYWDEVDTTVEPVEVPEADPHQRVSPHHVKPGHVRDFADGGRADEFRGGEFKPPLTPESRAAWDNARSGIEELHDDLLQAQLMERIGTGELTHTQAQAIWQKHVEKLRRSEQ